MSEYRLVMKGVVKTFPGVKALDHAQLELRPGKVMALMGENGAGKSTLMKCMFGIYKMDEGEIEYEGEKVVIANPLEALGRGIAMVHQELQPIPARTVAENIWLGRYPTKSYGPITVVDHPKMYTWPVTSARKKACCACAPVWACTPTTARPGSGPSWRMLPR